MVNGYNAKKRKSGNMIGKVIFVLCLYSEAKSGKMTKGGQNYIF